MNASKSSGMIIRLLSEPDLKAVVAIHLEAFQGFFLTFLGPRFLSELYLAIRTDPTGIAFVCEEQNKIVGFVAGTERPSGFYRRLIQKRWWRFGLASVGSILQKPSIIPRLARAFNMPEEAGTPEGCGTLMSIGISPRYQGKGIGQDLVKFFLQEASARNLSWVNLTTDADNNDRTNRFYSKFGFTCKRTYVTPEGRRMKEYIIPLSSPTVTPDEGQL